MVDVPTAKSYDIVVIGAGPAGSSAARAAAERGAEVLLIDRRERIGAPVRCAELVSQWIARYAHFTSSSILQMIETMVTHLPDGKCCEMKGPGYMLDRSLFDQELASSAALSGATIFTETRGIGLSPGGLIVEQGCKRETIPSKVLIGADGVHSTTARWLGLPSAKTIVALQYEVINPLSQNHVDIFFHRDYEGGYGWFFPKGKTANVGVGVVPSKTNLLLRLMEDFLHAVVRSKKLHGLEIIGKTGGSIPCGIPGKTVFGNVLLVGDAAGHAHPITGSGILNAVIGGEIAGRVAAEAVLAGNLQHLEDYENQWREAFGKPLFHGACKRRMLEENWNSPGIDLEGLIRQTWVGFKEYYKDRRKIPLFHKEGLWEVSEKGK